MSRDRTPEHDNYISTFKNKDNACGKGYWQAIGYIDNTHVSAFGHSPRDAMDKALAEFEATLQAEDDGMDLV